MTLILILSEVLIVLQFPEEFWELVKVDMECKWLMEMINEISEIFLLFYVLWLDETDNMWTIQGFGFLFLNL
jgi:hypothetical protein